MGETGRLETIHPEVKTRSKKNHLEQTETNSSIWNKSLKTLME